MLFGTAAGPNESKNLLWVRHCSLFFNHWTSGRFGLAEKNSLESVHAGVDERQRRVVRRRANFRRPCYEMRQASVPGKVVQESGPDVVARSWRTPSLREPSVTPGKIQNNCFEKIATHDLTTFGIWNLELQWSRPNTQIQALTIITRTILTLDQNLPILKYFYPKLDQYNLIYRAPTILILKSEQRRPILTSETN